MTYSHVLIFNLATSFSIFPISASVSKRKALSGERPFLTFEVLPVLVLTNDWSDPHVSFLFTISGFLLTLVLSHGNSHVLAWSWQIQ